MATLLRSCRTSASALVVKVAWSYTALSYQLVC
jgi:hypothetical protein